MILIHCSEDGDHSVEQLPKEVFLKKLNDGEYGDNGDNGPLREFMAPNDLGKRWFDLNTFVGIILVDGDVVVPKVKEIVKKFTL